MKPYGNKVLIVQGLTEKNIEPTLLKQFWHPCMATVKRWAERSGFVYKYFSDRRNEEFDITPWNTKRRADRDQTTINQFHKLQWMDGWSDYDFVFWIDSDCYAWGDPQFQIFSTVTNPSLLFLYNDEVVLRRWRRPVMSIWGGHQSKVQEAVDWARYQFENPDDQDEIVQALRCLNRYPLTNDDNLKGMASDLTEEVFMIGYTHPREDESIIFLTEGQKFTSIGKSSGSWTHDSFVHFGGDTKHRQLTRFRAYLAYMAHISQATPKDYGDEWSYEHIRSSIFPPNDL
tara:strand:+ start:2050 stop:2910 length:861 start_codon:yes stop_codon:yes gene_type:complete